MKFEKLIKFMNDIDSAAVPDRSIIIYQNHQQILNYSVGFSNLEKTKPASTADMHFIYSATKIFTCTAAMQLIEQGKLSPDDAVSKYLPEFAHLKVKTEEGLKPAENTLTVKHLFTMTGGFSYEVDHEEIKTLQTQTNYQCTTREMMKAIAKMPLCFEPGEYFKYSLCHDILAAVVEVVSQKTYAEYLKENIFAPLGIKKISFRLNEEVLKDFTQHYISENGKAVPTENAESANRFILSNRYESGGAGLIASADEYILLIDALANGGTGKTGKSILKPETIDMMRQNMLNDQQYSTYKVTDYQSYRYGYGVRTKCKNTKDNRYAPYGQFGWDGAAGAYMVIDPENHIAMFYAQHVLGCNYAFDEVHGKLRELMYEEMGFKPNKLD